jgi:hypothetical protein
MGGKPHHLYRQMVSRWAVAPRGCTLGVKELVLKGTDEARGKPPRGRAWLRKPMVSKRSRKRPTGKLSPASRPCLMGQRLHPTVLITPKDDRGWLNPHTSPKDAQGQPALPLSQSGFREERLGSGISDHLQAFAEDIMVNVGGSDRHGNGCSPRMVGQSVGGAIVLGGRESRPQGEGCQSSEFRSPLAECEHRGIPGEHRRNATKTQPMGDTGQGTSVL